MNIQTRREFDALKAVLWDAPFIICDTETFPIEPNKPTYLMGIAVRAPVKGRGETYVNAYLPYRHQHMADLFEKDKNLPLEWMEELEPIFAREDCEWVFHNGKFDLKVLELDDLIIKGKIWDSMIMSHMSDENGPHGLNYLHKKFFPDRKDAGKIDLTKISKSLAKVAGVKNPKKMDGWHLIPPHVMAEYAVKDLKDTQEVFQVLHKDLQKQYVEKCGELWDREEEYMQFLKEMEQVGVLINKGRTLTLLDECVDGRAAIQDELGFDPGKLDVLAHRLFSPVPKGLGLSPGPIGKPSSGFPLGRPSTAKAVLLRNPHPVTEKVLQYRGYVKAEGTWFRGFLDKVHPDGRVHADYKQHGTVTTRLSCQNPNMQQLPREGDPDDEDIAIRERVKEILDVEDGKELWEFDYSQMEFRLAGCYSKEPAILEAYRTGSDMHQTTADMLGVGRFEAKTGNFLTIYGGGFKKLMESLGLEEQDAKEFLANFWEGYPLLKQTFDLAEKAAAQRGFVTLWTGRRRHFRYPSEARKAFNSIVQGGGAEIVKETGLRLRRIRNEKNIPFQWVAQVHDSYWFEVEKGREDILDLIQYEMEWPGREGFHTPFPVDRKLLAA